MSIPIIAFFNNKSNVGTTSLVYHLSWMLADCGFRVLAVDLDPQADLSAEFLEEDRIEELTLENVHPQTMYGAILPLLHDQGDITTAHVEPISEELGLIIGDMALSTTEELYSEMWSKCLDGTERAFRVISAFWRVMQLAGEQHQADVIMVDLGPNLSAINRSALIAADFVITPFGANIFSIQGMQNFGPVLQRWHHEWQQRLSRNPESDLQLPTGSMTPLGYVLIRPPLRLDRPIQAFPRWRIRIPALYQEYMMNEGVDQQLTLENDPNCLAQLKNYFVLLPMARDVHKPMFFLKPADGAQGSIGYAVIEVRKDYRMLAQKIARKAGIREL